jgi:hypothetical protein
MNYTDQETEETICPELYEIQEFKNEVEDLFQEESSYDFYPRKWGYEQTSHKGAFLGSLREDKTFGDVEVSIKILIVLRYGYYEGANLDYEVQFSSGSCWEDEPDFRFDFESRSYMNSGMIKIQSRNAEKWAVKESEEMIKEIEKLFTQVTTPYRKLGSFSNGEGVYEKM